METIAVRHVDPAEVPALVREAVQIADDEQLTDADRAALLPMILDVLARRTVLPPMPALLANPNAILGPLGRGI